jgi:hypothetical protein
MMAWIGMARPNSSSRNSPPAARDWRRTMRKAAPSETARVTIRPAAVISTLFSRYRPRPALNTVLNSARLRPPVGSHGFAVR